MAHQKIFKRLRNEQEEAIASGIFSPGHLLKMDSADKVLKHSTEGADGAIRVALEQPYTGKTVADAYAVGDTAFYRECLPGDVVAVFLKAGVNYNTLNVELIHDGAGCLKLKSAATSAGVVKRVVAELLETVNLSATAAVATLAKVRIVG